MSISAKPIVCGTVLLLAGLGIGRAALYRFQEKEQAIRQACQVKLQGMGLTRAAAKTKFPTPEIRMVSSGCLLPGGTSDVLVQGKFAPDTKFVFQNDNLEVVKESLTPTEYRATVKAAQGIGPQKAAVTAISAVSCITARHEDAVAVGGTFEWAMDAANGWRIVARPAGAKPCGAPARGKTATSCSSTRRAKRIPLRSGAPSLHYSMYEKTNHRFAISQEDPATRSGAEDMQELMKKMGDPNLTDTQREKMMQQVQKAQEKLMAGLKEMTGPAGMEKLQAKQQQFGCERIEIAAASGKLAGEMRCSDLVGRRIALTGTMKFLGK